MCIPSHLQLESIQTEKYILITENKTTKNKESSPLVLWDKDRYLFHTFPASVSDLVVPSEENKKVSSTSVC